MKHEVSKGRGAILQIGELRAGEARACWRWITSWARGGDAARYRAQMREYRAAMQSVYAGKTVRCALVFADGVEM